MPDTWEALKHDCKNCRECSLWETRTNVVFGVGNQNAEVLFIGEGPGANEDAQGVPFVGRAGHLLDDMLEIIGLKRDDVSWYANIAGRRPPEKSLPPSRSRCCVQKIVLPSPDASSHAQPDFKITREHGQWFEKNGFQMMAVYHPAALLRDPRHEPGLLRGFHFL